MGNTEPQTGHVHTDEHQGHHAHSHRPITVEDAGRSLLLLGQVALDAGDYESAAQAFASMLELGPNEVASYNLGSFYARGLGVRRNYMEAARLFHQAELLGNERAGKLCAKSMFDFICDGLAAKKPADVYAAMAVFVSRVYPEAADKPQEVYNGLVAVASTLQSRGAVDEAAKVFRAATEFGVRETS